jgi:hypothetical protein
MLCPHCGNEVNNGVNVSGAVDPTPIYVNMNAVNGCNPIDSTWVQPLSIAGGNPVSLPRLTFYPNVNGCAAVGAQTITIKYP